MTDLPATRRSLILQLGTRSDAAWAEFLQIYEKAIIGYCIRRGLQEADAHDVAQAVYQAIDRKIPDWDPDASRGSFRAWIFRVTRNMTVDHLTARSRNPISGSDTRTDELLSQVYDPSGFSDGSPTGFHLALRRSLFEWACGQVQAEVQSVTWQAFSLCAIDGRKPREVASLLEISVGNVYTAKCRVMAKIRDVVESWDLDDFALKDGEPSEVKRDSFP
ncbi:MAG: sigma-70 family RNA polymerase sigma factor [Planctomycetota bacterium]